MSNELDERMASQFEGAFLDASDIMGLGKNITLTICEVVPPNTEKDATKKMIDKPILQFEKAKKRLILNKTNAKVISMAHGNKASQWTGKSITLTVRWLREAFGQSNVPVIRVVPPEGTALTFGMRKKYGSEKPFAPNREPGE